MSNPKWGSQHMMVRLLYAIRVVQKNTFFLILLGKLFFLMPFGHIRCHRNFQVLVIILTSCATGSKFLQFWCPNPDYVARMSNKQKSAPKSLWGVSKYKDTSSLFLFIPLIKNKSTWIVLYTAVCKYIHWGEDRFLEDD